MVNFSENISRALCAAKMGRKDLTKWLSVDLVQTSSFENLSIAIKNSGRYTCRVLLPSLDLYGDPDEFFKLGALCWIYSLHKNFDQDFVIPLQSEFETEYANFVISGYDSVKKMASFDLPRCLITSDISTISPLIGFGKGRCTHGLAFGVFDKSQLGFSDSISSTIAINKAVVFTASRHGLRAFAKSLMTFSVLRDRYDEMHFSHDGNDCALSRFSYEANILRTGSFSGDAIFDQ